MEFAAESEGGITVVCEASPGPDGGADAMATAAASVVSHLLDAGAEVELVVPDGSLDLGVGDRQRRAAYELLARTSPGRVDAEALDAADVRIVANGEVTVHSGDRSIPFDRLTEGGVNPIEGVPA
jgi:uncharacterized protein (DUF58 family)